MFLATTWPLSSKPFNRLVLAQDTGGAIRGAVRADFFWGSGDAAGELAGKMKQKGRAWVLMPREYSMGKSDCLQVSHEGTSK
jgi:membrane-bound lytic murein transglycosylase A